MENPKDKSLVKSNVKNYTLYPEKLSHEKLICVFTIFPLISLTLLIDTFSYFFTREKKDANQLFSDSVENR